jgi:DNA repair exonuclease SbcCD nuclease subunit
MFRFIHTADLHLDSPLRAWAGAPLERLTRASRDALRALIDLALEQDVAFVLIAGDLWDSAWRDYATCLFLCRQLARLKEKTIPVFVIRGNHDAHVQGPYGRSLPDPVIEFSAERPQTHLLDRFGVAVHGQSFSRTAVSENLARGYPDALPGYFNIGLLHSSLDGREGHAPYAPCQLGDLRALGYDYWALGHIHQREVLSQEPWILYPGNIQGRHIRESGDKGCALVEVRDGRVSGVDFPSLASLRWESVELCLKGEGFDSVLSSSLDALEQLADTIPLMLRFDVVGWGEEAPQILADQDAWDYRLREQVAQRFGDRVWVEKVKWKLKQAEQHLFDEGPLEELDLLLKDLEADPVALEELFHPFAKLRSKTRQAFRDNEEELWEDTEQRLSLVQEARALLQGRLMAGGSNVH